MNRRQFLIGFSLFSSGFYDQFPSIFNENMNESNSKHTDLIINVHNFGAVGTGLTDDSTSIQEAINEAENTGKPVVIPHGRYLLRNELVIKDSITIYGMGVRSTILIPAPEFNGFILTIDDCWRNSSDPSGEGLMQPSIDMNKIRSGVRLSGFSIIGDRRSKGIPSGIRTFDRVDQLEINSVDVVNLQGEGIALGKYGRKKNKAIVRESYFQNLFIRHCGTKSKHKPFTISTGAMAGDGSNQLYFNGLHLVENFASSLIESKNIKHGTRRIHFFGLMLHGRNKAIDAPPDDLLTIMGKVEDVRIYGLAANGSHCVDNVQYGTIRLKSDERGTSPAAISIDGDTRSCQGHGYILEACKAVRITGTVQPVSISGAELLVTGNKNIVVNIVYDVLATGSEQKIIIKSPKSEQPNIVIYTAGIPPIPKL